MLRRLLPLFLLSAALLSCQEQRTRITSVADLPLKTTETPGFEWKSSPLRANARYVLFESNSDHERRDKLGDYYFVRWYDSEPTKPVSLVMHYTQASTGPQVLERRIEYREPRESSGSHREHFFFAGPERARKGDILSWKIELYCDGKLVDSEQSYLWE